VINAQNGIEMMTSRFMQWAGKRGLDRLIIVNKIDAENVNLPSCSKRSRRRSARNACR
jgi:elongation factor G